MNKTWLAYLLIFAVALAQYANTRNHDFAWDDAIVITENSRVQKGLSNIPEIFENIKTAKTENRYGYRPISLLSFATDVEFFGINSKASHRVSILLYALLCVLIMLFLQTIFPNQLLQNFLITLLFVVHPLHTEVVANIKSRDEVLAMSFGVLSMLSFYKGIRNTSLLSHVAFVFFLIMAFLSKENAVVFCGVAMLLFWYRLPNIDKKTNAKYVGIIVGSFILILATRFFVYSDFFFQNSDAELTQKGLYLKDGFVGNPLVLVESSLVDKWLSIMQLVLFHVYKFFIPYPLVHDYSYNSLELFSTSNPWCYVVVVVSIGLALLTVKAVKKRTTVGFGIGFFFVTASVYLHVVGLAPDIFAERFVFVSSLGLCIAIVHGSFVLIRNSKLRFLVVGSWLAISVIFFSMSWKRNEAWKNNETLLKTDIDHLSNGARINYNMALYLHRKYYEIPASQRLAMQDSILYYYERTLQITDRLFPAYIDLGGAYMEFQKPEKAREVFQKTIDNYPKLSPPYVQMAKYHMTNKDYQAAVPLLQKAIQFGKANADYYYLLAICQFNSNDKLTALETLQIGEKYASVTAAYYLLMFKLNEKMGQVEMANVALEKGLKLFPSDSGLLQVKSLRSNIK